MKRTFFLAAAVLVVTSCSVLRDSDSANSGPYDNPFYAKYLNTGSSLDAQITQTLAALRQNPDSPELHNTLGALLIEKGFPNDAAREFERAVDVNGKYFPAWYNLGLVRASQGDELGARRAFGRTVDLKPGHAAALFQLGLIEEKREHIDRAVALYAKAFTINPALLEVAVNPRILDTQLTHLALLEMYPTGHSRRSMQFQGAAPAGGATAPAAASPQAAPQDIVTPAPPATDPSMRPRAATVVPRANVVGGAEEPETPRRDTRGRRRRAEQAAAEQAAAEQVGITPSASGPTPIE